MSGDPAHPHPNIVPDGYRNWRPSVTDSFSHGPMNLPQYEYASSRPQDGYSPRRTTVEHRYAPPQYQHDYAEPRPQDTYPATQPSAPSTSDQSRYNWTSPHPSYPERPPNPQAAAGHPNDHYEGSGGADRSPLPEEDTRGSPAGEKIVIPMGPSSSREREPTNGKPFVLLGCVLDAFDLAENILDFSIYVYGSGSFTTRPVKEFVESLTAYGVGLRGIQDIKFYFRKEKEIRLRWPKANDDIKPCSDKAKDLNARIQDLIFDCEEAMPKHCRHSDGALKYRACIRFVRTMLVQRVRATDQLSQDMRRWCDRYDKSCAPLLENMEMVATEIEEDRQRREEEDNRRRRREEDKRRREEDDRRREEHSQKSLVYRHKKKHH